MKSLQLFIFIGLSSILTHCDRVDYFPDKPIVDTETYFLAHKGGGEFDEGNTLQACIYGLEMIDGIECDIQKSSNNTLWLNHSAQLQACGSFQENCFAASSDNAIIQIDSCMGPEKNYTLLEEVLKKMNSTYPDKYISLDMKAWTPCDLAGVNITTEMNEIAQKIIDLTQKYNLNNKVLVESETGDFLYYFKKNVPYIETYLSTNGDFELGVSRALNAGFSGISFKYKFDEAITKEHVELLHRKGLKIQLWTVSDITDIEEAIALQPDFIQTDLVSYVHGK